MSSTDQHSIVEMYTDGACKGNPGIGGWGVLVKADSRHEELCGHEIDTTNNRMELLAAIRGLEHVGAEQEVILYSDSQYVCRGITEWIEQWKSRGWKTTAGKLVKNQELWVKLDDLCNRQHVRWQWVRGHAGNPGNERADALANHAIEKFLDSISGLVK